MDGLLLALLGAFWAGLLTAISPCPLTTNVAAMSFVARRVGEPRQVLVSGLLYTMGRVLAYVALGTILGLGLVSVPGLSVALQTHANRLLGPVLILVGMVLVGLLVPGWSFSAGGQSLGERVEKGRLLWALALGFVFALSFCPPSAMLFFGTVLPLSVKTGVVVLVPVIYGMGTGLPVLVFAFLIALGARSVAGTFERIRRFELWARRITGGVFILGGIYLSLIYVYGVNR